MSLHVYSPNRIYFRLKISQYLGWWGFLCPSTSCSNDCRWNVLWCRTPSMHRLHHGNTNALRHGNVLVQLQNRKWSIKIESNISSRLKITCIPYLQFDLLTGHFDYSCAEFHADGMWTIGHDCNRSRRKNDENNIFWHSIWDYSHFFSVNWCKRHDLPTPMSPIIMYLKI